MLIPAYNEEARDRDQRRGPRSPSTIQSSRCSSSTTARPTPPRPQRSRQARATRAAGCSATRSAAARGRPAERVASSQARHEAVAVTDADTHMHPRRAHSCWSRAWLGRRSGRGRRGTARHQPGSACSPRCRCWRRRRSSALIRRTQSVSRTRRRRRRRPPASSAATVSLPSGATTPRMATEDIDLSWKLLLRGWHTACEPRALVGMQVPASLGALWMQRER